MSTTNYTFKYTADANLKKNRENVPIFLLFQILNESYDEPEGQGYQEKIQQISGLCVYKFAKPIQIFLFFYKQKSRQQMPPKINSCRMFLLHHIYSLSVFPLLLLLCRCEFPRNGKKCVYYVQSCLASSSSLF